MLLEDWLIKKKMKAYRFSKLVGINHAVIYRSIGHKRRMSATTAVKIEEYTKGEVSRCEAMWPEHYLKSPLSNKK